MILVAGKNYNLFVQHSRLGFHVIILFLVLLFVPSISFADITVRVANLKQDMELVTRELAGLRTEVELLRRENAQLKVQLEHSTRKQSSNAGVSGEVLQRMSERMKQLEFKLLQSEKSQLTLQKSIDLKMTELITQMNSVLNSNQSQYVLGWRKQSSTLLLMNYHHDQTGVGRKADVDAKGNPKGWTIRTLDVGGAVSKVSFTLVAYEVLEKDAADYDGEDDEEDDDVGGGKLLICVCMCYMYYCFLTARDVSPLFFQLSHDELNKQIL